MIESKIVLCYVPNQGMIPKDSHDKTKLAPKKYEVRADDSYVYQWTGKTWKRSSRTVLGSYPMSAKPMVDHIFIDENKLCLTRTGINGSMTTYSVVGRWRK